MMKQTMPDPTDETRRTMPCPTRLVDMATIARANVAMKKTKPRPKIQKVRNPRIRHIQPALTADDFARPALAAEPVSGSDGNDGSIAKNNECVRQLSR